MNQGGRFQIPQRWLYVAAAVGVLFGIYVVYGLLTAGLQAYLALIAGVMLLIGNAPELLRSLQQRDMGVAMMNTLVGAGLVSYFIGSVALQIVFWPLAIVLLALAVPLVFGRAKVAGTYINSIRLLLLQARHFFGARSRSI